MKLLNFFIFVFLSLTLTFKNSYGLNYFFLKKNTESNSSLLKNILSEQSIELNDLLSSIDDFIDMPKNGTSWQIFGETGMIEYTFTDKEGYDWLGVRPRFKEKVKKLNGKEILIQGYMFPLEQGEKQSLFLLNPFPISCPYHPHVSSNLTIEVHAKSPVEYTYDAVNIKGKLELVKNDNLYNIFFRLKNSKLVP